MCFEYYSVTQKTYLKATSYAQRLSLAYLSRRRAMLFPDDVQDGLLSDKKHVFDSLHAEQLIGIEPLHPNDFVVALPIVEDGLGEIFQHVGRVQYRHPGLGLP